MPKKLFVGGLSWGTTDADLAAAFSQFGPIVEAKVITDRETGRSRGFGFVTFEDPAHGATAMENMDGATLDDRTIRVNEAQERSGGGGGGGPRNGPKPFRGGGGGGDFGDRPRGGGGGRDRDDGGFRGDSYRDRDRGGGRGGRGGRGDRRR